MLLHFFKSVFVKNNLNTFVNQEIYPKIFYPKFLLHNLRLFVTSEWKPNYSFKIIEFLFENILKYFTEILYNSLDDNCSFTWAWLFDLYVEFVNWNDKTAFELMGIGHSF